MNKVTVVTETRSGRNDFHAIPSLDKQVLSNSKSGCFYVRSKRNPFIGPTKMPEVRLRQIDGKSEGAWCLRRVLLYLANYARETRLGCIVGAILPNW